MSDARGRGRARGRARPQDGSGQRPGPAGPGPQTGGPQQPGPPRSAWGGPQPQPSQQPPAWGPPQVMQTQYQVRAPAPPPQAMQSGRATYRGAGAGDGPNRDVSHEGVVKGSGEGDASRSASRGAARGGGRVVRYQNLIRTKEPEVRKQGDAGRKIMIQSNYLALTTTGKQFLLYQYRVDFNPEVDVTYEKKQYYRTAMGETFKIMIFDGTVVYSHMKLPNDITEKFVQGKEEGETIRVTTKFVGDVMQTDYHYLQVFNIILRTCLAKMQLKLINRNYFDPEGRIDVPEFKMSIWPGYTTSIRQHENQILLNVAITHKVMRTDTVLSLLNDCVQSSRTNYKDEFTRRVIGCVVATPYNKTKTYRVDDVDWDSNPKSTFSISDGSQTSYVDYFKKKYNQNITNLNQPLLVSRAKKREIRAGLPELLFLVPELCIMTGLTDRDREDTQLMRALANHTRIMPGDRIRRLMDFQRRLKNSPGVLQELKQWDMHLADSLIEFEARNLNAEELVGGQGKNYTADDKGDWTRNLRSAPMVSTGKLDKFAVVYPARLGRETEGFIQALLRAAGGMSWRIGQPKTFEIPDDRPSTYLNQLQTVASMKPNLILCVVTNNKQDRYNAIKKKLTVEFAIPSQVIVGRTINNPKSLLSIATKVAIQLNCKVGGAPWGLKIPAKHIMIVGYDVCHDPHDKRKSYSATVASLDALISRYYSNISKHDAGEELSNDLALSIIKAIKEFVNINNTLPERIIVFRDGVGEGQLNYVIEHEVQSIVDKLTASVYKEKPLKLAFIIVNKRISTRLFFQGKNVPHGTVVDNHITCPERYDFFIASQHVDRGTVTPTYYNIVYNTTGFGPNVFQQLAYKLCHGYYNWSGTVRVPAPCQFAHKLAFLVSQSLQRDPHAELRNLLYYL